MLQQLHGNCKNGGEKWTSANFLTVLFILLSSILFFIDLFKDRYILIERDLGPYFIPPRFFWVESIKSGDFPLWNPYQFSGHPFFANPQNAIFYPLNSFFFVLPFDIAFNGIIILHFFLGGFFTYLFLKDLKVSNTGAIISGLVFMLSGYLLSVHSLLSCLFSVIWTPLIMMFFRRAIVSPSFKNEVFTGILLTISFLGGGVEIVYGIFFILFFMVVFPVPSDSSEEVPLIEKLRHGIKTLLIISIIFLIFSAVQLVPFVELLYHSIRRGGISFQEATTWSFAPKDILLFFLPDAYGYFLDIKKYWITQCWLKTLYSGGLPFILSAIYFIYGKKRKLFLSLMLFSIFLSLGNYNPLYQFIFKYVPFFDSIRYPVKFLYIFILVLSITAGLGFDSLLSIYNDGKSKRFKNVLIFSALISGLTMLLFVLQHEEIKHFMILKGINFPDFNYASVNLYNTKRFFFYLTIFFLLLRIGHEFKWKGWIKFLLIIFLTADLFGNMGFYGREKTTEYFKKTRISEVISSDKGQFRVFTTERTTSMDVPILIGNATYIDYLKEKHLPSMNQIYKIHNIWGIDVIHLKRTDELYRALTETPSISATNLIDLYGVKYVISVTPIESEPKFELIYARTENLEEKRDELLKKNTIKLYRNKSFSHRAWLVKDYRIIDSKDILSEIKKKDFNPQRVVFLEEEPKFNHSFSRDHTTLSKGSTPFISLLDKKQPLLSPLSKGHYPPLSPLSKGGREGGVVEFLNESNNKISILVKSNDDAFLVLNDTYFPGWKVYVDGKKEKIYCADYNFRAVPVREGVHKVEFIYDPLSFKLGAVISISGITGFVITGFVIRSKNRSRDV